MAIKEAAKKQAASKESATSAEAAEVKAEIDRLITHAVDEQMEMVVGRSCEKSASFIDH